MAKYCLSFFGIGSPDTFFVVTVDGGQTRSGPVAKSSLSPFWNYSMDLYALPVIIILGLIRAF